jgi:WD40 repeat protein
MNAASPKPVDAGRITAVPAREYDFAAYVSGALFTPDGTPVFALGDGTLRIADGHAPRAIQANQGAILSLAVLPDGSLVTGGDDGALVQTTREGGREALFQEDGRWIENVTVSPDGRSLACSAGREAIVVIASGKRLPQPRRFPHSSTAAGLAFDPKGKRLAVAHYGGVSLWWTASETQTPVVYPWRGSHLKALYSPDGRYLLTAMQENSLHGWRIADRAHFQMSGFPAKIKSMSWGPKGRWLITSGASQGLIWSFEGKQGPIGRDAREIGEPRAPMICAVAAHPSRDLAAMGHADGSLVLGQALGGETAVLRLGDGAAISALAWSGDGERLAAGSESGFAAILTFKREAL